MRIDVDADARLTLPQRVGRSAERFEPVFHPAQEQA